MIKKIDVENVDCSVSTMYPAWHMCQAENLNADFDAPSFTDS